MLPVTSGCSDMDVLLNKMIEVLLEVDLLQPGIFEADILFHVGIICIR